jgi:hypothetical protein
MPDANAPAGFREGARPANAALAYFTSPVGRGVLSVSGGSTG